MAAPNFFLPVLPHLVDLLPPVLECLQPLPQEHVLGVVEGRGVGSHLRRWKRESEWGHLVVESATFFMTYLLAVLHHGDVVPGVGVDLLPDLLVLFGQK